MPSWWKEAIIYQVYPRSFKDCNEDGIGDLRGVLEQLEYIRSLGVDAIYLNPIYPSSGHDNGYDITDFCAVDPVFGTIGQLEELIRRLHAMGMRLIQDLVINHTSDEHEWFKQAQTSRDNPYYNYYIWWPAENGKPVNRRGFFDPACEAWRYNTATDSWYLHYFSPHQPDLNWDNPVMRQDIYRILRWWLEKGIDGLRFDALTFISKDKHWPEMTEEILKDKYQGDWGHFYANGPCLHDFLREMHEEVMAHYPDAVAIAEASGVGTDRVLDFVADDRKELNLLYHFDGMSIGFLPDGFKRLDPAGYSRREWKEVYSRWSDVFRQRGWGPIYLGNHDQARMVSRWGDDSPESAKLLFTFLLTMRATPFIFQGDELGMTNIYFTRIEEYKDIETRQMYGIAEDKEGFLADQRIVARDNSRTPFQWDASPQACFTTAKPWIRVNKNYKTLNREAEEKDPNSVLNYVRRLIRLRKENPVLTYGDYRLLLPEHPALYVYQRRLGKDLVTVVLNFSAEEQVYPEVLQGRILCNNYENREARLKPWQAVVIDG